jgi:hypothetical protein
MFAAMHVKVTLIEGRDPRLPLMPSRLQIDVLRANAIEKLGDVNTAVAQLVAAARAFDGDRAAIPGVVALNSQLQLCPQSVPRAMRE